MKNSASKTNNYTAFEMSAKMQDDTDTDDNQSETEDAVVSGHSINNQTLEACAVR